MTQKDTHIPPPAAPRTGPPGDGLQQIIAACLKDDRAAQRRLYEAYGSFIFGIIRRFTADESVAQDIQSEAFYRIFKRLEQYRFEGAFEGWMRRIAVHAVADYFRKHKTKDGPLPETMEDVAAYADGGGPAGLAYKELLVLIHELPATQRGVFNLFVFEQYTHKEIADMLDITENNSRWHLNDARRRLKEKINATNR